MAASKAGAKFAELLRTSKFIELGDFRNKTITGTVFHMTTNDLYVDVGLKFHAVVKKPRNEAYKYVRGAQVSVKLIDYEITDRFVGTKKDVSMFEADAILLGLVSSPIGTKPKPIPKAPTLEEKKD